MDEKTDFGLIEPFDIDDGSLKDITPAYAFALGVEWQLFRQQLHTGKPFSVLCLPQNTKRLVAMAERHGRFVEDRKIGYVGWTEIWVGDAISCEPPLTGPM